MSNIRTVICMKLHFLNLGAAKRLAACLFINTHHEEWSAGDSGIHRPSGCKYSLHASFDAISQQEARSADADKPARRV